MTALVHTTAAQVELLAKLPMEFDFYPTYQMKNTEHNERWRLYVPKGFVSPASFKHEVKIEVVLTKREVGFDSRPNGFKILSMNIPD